MLFLLPLLLQLLLLFLINFSSPSLVVASLFTGAIFTLLVGGGIVLVGTVVDVRIGVNVRILGLDVGRDDDNTLSIGGGGLVKDTSGEVMMN